MAARLLVPRKCPVDVGEFGQQVNLIQAASLNYVGSRGKDLESLAWANFLVGYISMRLLEACCKPPGAGTTLMQIGDTIFNLHKPLPEPLGRHVFNTYLEGTLHRMDEDVKRRGGVRRGQLLPGAWADACAATTQASKYGYTLFRHAASTANWNMLHLGAADARKPRSSVDITNCLSRALLGLLYSHQHGLPTRVVRYATQSVAPYLATCNKALPEHGSRSYNHLSVDPTEDGTMSQEYDPCDGSMESMAMAVEDFVVMPLWAELADLSFDPMHCRELNQYKTTLKNLLSFLQVSLGSLFGPRLQRDLFSPAFKFKRECTIAINTPVPDD
jgi:hypothetical protein